MSRFLLRCRVLHFFIHFVPGFGMDMIIIPRPRPKYRPESFQCSSIPAEPAFSCRDGNDVSADPVTPRQLHPMSRMSSSRRPTSGCEGVFENPIEMVIRPHGLASCLLIGFGKFAAHFSWLRHSPLFYDMFNGCLQWPDQSGYKVRFVTICFFSSFL